MSRAALFGLLLLSASCGGCSTVSVADAGVTVAANAVKTGANVIGGVSDVARAGVRAIANALGPGR